MNRPRILAVLAFLALACAAPLAAQHDGHAATVPDSTPRLYGEALGPFSWPVSTSSPEAQAYFDQGVKLMYAFAPDQAQPSFAQARTLDPQCVMCWWGEAWSLGPYLNGGMDDADAPAAFAAARRARELAEAGGTPVERALAEAMTARYEQVQPMGGRRGLDSAFAAAMEQVYARFPDDLQVAQLYADALMLLEPRRGIWNPEKPSVARIHQVLERALAADVAHPGVCHSYIHATETNRAGNAQTCADLLVNAMPGASHLNHMPSHTYNRMGRWNDAVLSNQLAWASDRRAAEGQAVSVYPGHNLHMLLFAASMDGQEAAAFQAARAYAAMPGNADGVSLEALVGIRFGRFGEVLALARAPTHPVHLGLWAFARGYAHLRAGAADSSVAYLTMVDSIVAHAPAGTSFRGHPAARLLGVAGNLLRGELMRADGRVDEAAAAFTEAVRLEDELVYDEPEPLPFAARDWLGSLLMEAGRAEEAERVYRAALDDRPHNGWSLFGLEQALRIQGMTAEADEVRARFQAAWVRSQVALVSSKF